MNAVDTNVLIYCCDHRDAAKQNLALDLVGSLRDTIIPWQVACEFIAATRRLSKYGFTPEQAWARLSEFLRIFPLALPAPAGMERAKELHLRSGLSFWDALILGACLEVGATHLYSEDVPGGRVPGIEVINPFA